MRFLIVGASGFVGRHTLAHVRRLGFPAIGTQSRPHPEGKLVHFNLLHHRIQDCVNRSFLDSDKPRFAVICVAFRSMEGYIAQRDITWKVNVDNTIELIKDLRRLGIRPVFISTNYLFDGTTGYYDEESPWNPISEYGRTKKEVEVFLRSEAPEVFVPRLDKIVGDDPNERHLFSEWWQLIEKRQPIECIAEQILAPTLVDDVARGIVTGCQLGLQGVYHLAGPEYFLRDELARQFVRALEVEAQVIAKRHDAFGFTEQRPLRCYLDSGRFRSATGMAFASMKDTFRAFRRNLLASRKAQA